MGDLKRASNDWYVDQPDAAAALLAVERFSGTSWDPACGIGTIPSVFHAHGLHCMGTDLVDRGYRHPSFGTADFLNCAGRFENIVSNPPFSLARPFADRALDRATHKVAFLLPLTFLEGAARAKWLEQTPLARVHVFSWRISMPPGDLLLAGKVKPEGGKKAFAWFVWEHGHVGPAQVRPLHREMLELKAAA